MMVLIGIDIISMNKRLIIDIGIYLALLLGGCRSDVTLIALSMPSPRAPWIKAVSRDGAESKDEPEIDC